MSDCQETTNDAQECKPDSAQWVTCGKKRSSQATKNDDTDNIKQEGKDVLCIRRGYLSFLLFSWLLAGAATGIGFFVPLVHL